ncbi:uncharacterized protein J3D65DRAFT_168009 [Phyllosticta citribraziliensis]|uniref:Cryptic loci regulator 2 N-terminal domain-containing protein n=1 Tax=Phyllosticta citribraziliensis TaxID=989973 RepID=A0ABR1L2L2_9PEZI
MATPQQMTLHMEDIACDSSHVPRVIGYVLDQDVAQWLQEVGEKYMAKVAELQPGALIFGVKYRFDRLPAGYSLWAKERSDGTRSDKYLYGHPQSRPFTSQKQFVEHLLHHLYHRGQANTCPCKACRPPTTAPRTPTVNRITTGMANLTTATPPPAMSAANAAAAAMAAAAASAPPPPPGAVVYGCPLPPGSWGAMPPDAPHGPAWYDKEFEKRMAKLKPWLHIYDTHMPGKHCEWCPKLSKVDYCTCCRRFYHARSADTTVPHYEGK